MPPARETVSVKLYGNRRLFEPAHGRYVALAELIARAAAGDTIIVRDAHSGADITDFILSRSPTEH